MTDCKLLWYLFRFAVNKKARMERASISNKGSFMGYDMDGKAINFDEIPQKYIDYYETHHSWKDEAIH